MVAQQIERIEGRQGEPKEFVEYRIEQAHRSFIAQESGGWWLVIDVLDGPKAPVEIIESFPPGRKDAAVACALHAAKAFVGKVPASAAVSCTIPVQN